MSKLVWGETALVERLGVLPEVDNRATGHHFTVYRDGLKLLLSVYQRAFQRTLRVMRDLRRYSSPVTFNNLQQVNIAADGGQQVNAIK